MPPKRRKMSSVAEDPVYEVEAIIGHLSFEEAHQRELNGILKPKLTLSMKEKSAKKHSKYVFLTRWLGWGEAGDTWEPESNLTTCKTILKDLFTWSETRPQIPRNKVENVIDVISFENWTYVERSHFCSIYDATWVLTGSNQPVNVTVAVYPDDKQTKSMIIALRLIKHNLIVRCFGRTVLNGKIGVVFEMPEKRPSLYSSEPRRFFESVNGEESVKR
ncbi:unnamed protein product [Caenorhabditis auriculariae]|uniref:Chromo domain-containing protein n=1 Tax=Caenorhabditis auriculariae TaxID=2777116 RepID=A0A8S1HGZ1_9PELO|nr:unnamed protein product [Caenorhabditis auriculariae]